MDELDEAAQWAAENLEEQSLDDLDHLTNTAAPETLQ